MNIKGKKIIQGRISLLNLLENSSICCGLCCAVLLDKYTGIHLKDFQKDRVLKISTTKKVNFIHLNGLDLITKGKVLEQLLDDIKHIDAFDGVDPDKLSRLTSHLQQYFDDKYLEFELKDTFAHYLVTSWRRKKHMSLINQKNKERISKEIRHKRVIKRKDDHEKRILRKMHLDKRRDVFLFMFSQLNSISKLKTLLEGIEIPLQAIPEALLPKPSLKLRFQVRKEFKSNELSRLRDMFGENHRNNKKKTWKKLIKVMK